VRNDVATLGRHSSLQYHVLRTTAVSIAVVIAKSIIYRIECHKSRGSDEPRHRGRVRRTAETGLYRRRDVDAKLWLARNGLGAEWHLVYHEFMKIHLQTRIIYVDAYNVS
jgi:hypothetical protein